MTATMNKPVANDKSLSNTVTFGTVNATFLLTGEDTGGAFSLIETIMRAGSEPPYHIHEREDETFYVLDGHLSVMVDSVIHECRTGQVIFLPRGIPHTFRVRSKIARALVMVAPSGFEKYFQSIGKPAVSLDPPREAPPRSEYIEVAARASAACGVRIADHQPGFPEQPSSSGCEAVRRAATSALQIFDAWATMRAYGPSTKWRGHPASAQLE